MSVLVGLFVENEGLFYYYSLFVGLAAQNSVASVQALLWHVAAASLSVVALAQEKGSSCAHCDAEGQIN